MELNLAQRDLGGATETVRLPDRLQAPEGALPPLRATYRMQFRLGAVPPGTALYLPGLRAHARVRLNGHVVADALGDSMEPLPRSLRSIRLIDVPPEFLRRGDNTLEIEAAGRSALSVSPAWLGPHDVLKPRYEWRLLGTVQGPALVAVAIGSLALCMLLLWGRRREPLYGFFGVGALAWAAHSAWSALPVSPLSGVHHVVWWTALYGFVVGMLVTFCVRFAGWQWPRFERVLWGLTLAAPPVLYAASALGALDVAQDGWRLGLIGVVIVGLVAVARYAWRRRDVESYLLLASGLVSLVFGVRDWLVAYLGTDNNPVYLVPYAGLLFVALVAWMMIDRFVTASRALERANSELEQRVASKSADLVLAVDQMRQARDAAQAANLAKSTFLAAASHDLRQPIHALGLYMVALRSESLSPAQAELLQRMNGSLTAMDTMFNALLDISRIDAGAVVPQPRPFALAPMLQRLADEFAPLAAQKGLRLSLRVAPAARSLCARSDPMLVERIVRNLLSNAVKFTHAGGVLLSCRLRHRGAATAHWRVEVWDTGDGIAKSERERVFDEYYQIGNPERDRAGGLGLGLSIVRRLTKLLKHRLTLHSRVGRGSRFVLDLPATADAAPQAAAADETAGSIAGLGVAVVDDDPEVRDSMQLLLTSWGCRAFTGADAAAVLRHAGPNPGQALAVIVADYRLREGRNGVGAIRALRAACGRKLPALIVSGDSDPERLADIRASGFDAMSKPVPAARLQAWLAREARRSALTPPAPTPAPAGAREGAR